MSSKFARSVSCIGVAALLGLGAFGTASAEMPQRHYAPGHNVRAAARQNARAPGVTRYISPNSRQTGTGGPAGGLPGRS